MRFSAKQKALILSFIGRADVPYYSNGGLAPALARLRKMGIVTEQYLSPYGQVVATALANGQKVPTKEQATKTAIERAMRHA